MTALCNHRARVLVQLFRYFVTIWCFISRSELNVSGGVLDNDGVDYSVQWPGPLSWQCLHAAVLQCCSGCCWNWFCSRNVVAASTKQPGGAINIFVCCIHYKCKTKYTEETMFDTWHMSVHSKRDKISLYLSISSDLRLLITPHHRSAETDVVLSVGSITVGSSDQ